MTKHSMAYTYIYTYIHTHTHTHTHGPQLHYPFIYQWTFRLFPCLWPADLKIIGRHLKLGLLHEHADVDHGS